MVTQKKRFVDNPREVIRESVAGLCKDIESMPEACTPRC